MPVCNIVYTLPLRNKRPAPFYIFIKRLNISLLLNFQLSNLSEGVYTFVLKVTDSSGQSSTAEVHVFVKPPTNTPPVADAGAEAVSIYYDSF